MGKNSIHLAEDHLMTSNCRHTCSTSNTQYLFLLIYSLPNSYNHINYINLITNIQEGEKRRLTHCSFARFLMNYFFFFDFMAGATNIKVHYRHLLYRPLHGIRHRKIQSSQCACRGQKVHSIPLNCVLTREFLVKTKLRAVTVADLYHRGGNGPTTTGGAVF